MLSKKHFIKLAEVCAYLNAQAKNPNTSAEGIANEAQESIVALCQGYNPRFDSGRFRDYVEKLNK